MKSLRVTDQPSATASWSTQPALGASDASTMPPPATTYEPSGTAAVVEDRPEVAAGAAFAAGFLFAMILRRLAR